MKAIAFTLGSGMLIYISRASLRKPHSHGVYRFFAWEFILALFLLNINFWFQNPFVSHQLIAWTLLIASLFPLILGISELKSRGKPAVKREGDPSLLAFEKTTQLVTSGIYKYIRHPLYSSLFLLTWGIFFKNISIIGMILAISATVFLVLTAKADEMECILFFGVEYQNYLKHTKRFIPLLF
jgi:protein-S-isoprenylcysteine O-methyltransferase Ste14